MDMICGMAQNLKMSRLRSPCMNLVGQGNSVDCRGAAAGRHIHAGCQQTEALLKAEDS